MKKKKTKTDWTPAPEDIKEMKKEKAKEPSFTDEELCSVTYKFFGGVAETSKSTSILTEAETIINGQRNTDYGDPTESFEKIAQIASLLSNKDLDADTCCAVMMAVKLTRQSFKHKRDNLVDLCGYAEIMNQIKSK